MYYDSEMCVVREKCGSRGEMGGVPLPEMREDDYCALRAVQAAGECLYLRLRVFRPLNSFKRTGF